jgi:hypothetical protein
LLINSGINNKLKFELYSESFMCTKSHHEMQPFPGKKMPDAGYLMQEGGAKIINLIS